MSSAIPESWALPLSPEHLSWPLLDLTHFPVRFFFPSWGLGPAYCTYSLSPPLISANTGLVAWALPPLGTYSFLKTVPCRFPAPSHDLMDFWSCPLLLVLDPDVSLLC